MRHPQSIHYEFIVRTLRHVWACVLVLLLGMNNAHCAISFKAASSAAAGGSVITYKASGGAVNAKNGNITATLPAAVLGDMFFCQVTANDNSAHSMPAGWNLAYSLSSGSTLRASLFYKVSGAKESNPLISHSGKGSISARCSRFSGMDANNPFDVVYAARFSAKSSAVSSASFSTQSSNTLLLFAAHLADNPKSLSMPSGWTQPYFSGANSSAVGWHYKTQVAPSPVGPISATASAASDNYGVLLALRAASNLVIGKPAATATGDVMIAALTVTPSTIALTPPAGWTLIQSQQQTKATSSVLSTYYRVASSSEPASYAWTFSSGHAGAVGGIATYVGVNNTLPVDVSAKAATAKSASHTAPSVTTTLAGDMLVSIHEYTSARSWTPPPGMTERVDIASGPAGRNGITLEMSDLLLGAAGASGTKTAKASANPNVGATMSIALRPLNVAPHHIEIVHDGSGVTCTPKTVTLRACTDATCSALFTGGGISGTVSPNGSAYTIGTTGSSTASISPTAAGTYNLSASVTPTPSTTPAVTCRNTATGSNSCSIVFTASGLTLTLPNFPSATGTNLATVRATDSRCASAFSGNRSLRFYSAYTNPSSGMLLATINGSAISNVAASPTTLSLNFNSSGVSTFTLNYADVGRITLDATDALTTTRGNGQFVAYPTGFALSAIQRSSDNFPNPGAANAAGVAFIKAGDNFNISVRAINALGNTTANFGRETPAESVQLSTALLADPDLSNNPALNGTFGAFSNGSASGSFNWNEVGILQLTPSLLSGNYLGIGVNVSGPVSGNIGRFYPHHFGLTPHASNPLLNRADTSCSNCVFSYMGEAFNAQFALSAQALNNATTLNYHGAYAKLNLTTGANPLSFGAVDGATYLSTRVSLTAPASGAFNLGVASNIVAPLLFSRGASADGPYHNLRIGIAPQDSDGVGMGLFNLDTDAALPGNDHALLGSTSMRYGRLRLSNAHGSELLALPIPVAAQYWNSAGYITNNDDNHTTVSISNVLLSNYQRNLNSGETLVSAPSIVNGIGKINLSAPGAGNDGSVDLSTNQPTYLPSGTSRATFGIYKGGPVIYQRENY